MTSGPTSGKRSAGCPKPTIADMRRHIDELVARHEILTAVLDVLAQSPTSSCWGQRIGIYNRGYKVQKATEATMAISLTCPAFVDGEP